MGCEVEVQSDGKLVGIGTQTWRLRLRDDGSAYDFKQSTPRTQAARK
jgi:hypothetical protein